MQLEDKSLLMLQFKPRISGVRSDRSTNNASTTAQGDNYLNYLIVSFQCLPVAFAADELKLVLRSKDGVTLRATLKGSLLK